MTRTPQRALICGTRPDSIGRHIASRLLEQGWEVWLYSRSARPRDSAGLHERAVDISAASQIEALLDEIGSVSMVILAADTGTGFGNLEELSAAEVDGFMDAKLRGSVHLVRELMRRKMEAKLIWLCGRPGPKPAEFVLYGPANSFLLTLAESVNLIAKGLSAYYLETPVVKSPISKAYETRMGTFPADWEVYEADDLMPQIERIMNGTVPPGIVPFPGRAQ